MEKTRQPGGRAGRSGSESSDPSRDCVQSSTHMCVCWARVCSVSSVPVFVSANLCARATRCLCADVFMFWLKKSVCAFTILEVDESTRMRMGTPHHHEDHVAGKGENPLQHDNLVHDFVQMPQGMKILAGKVAVDKEWDKLGKNSAWNLMKVKSKKQVIEEARTSGATVHFASLMDICHLKNAELEAKHQKYKGQVVLRGDFVKR